MRSTEIGELKKRIHDLEATRSLAETLSQSQTVNETLRQIAEWCARVCQADFVSILLFREETGDSVVTVVRTGEANAPVGIDHALNTLMAGHVKVHGTSMIVEDVIREMGYRTPSERRRSYGPALAVPLAVRGETIGVLNMVNRRGQPAFTTETLRLAESTAPLISLFIERARVQEKKSLDHALVLSAAPGMWPRQWIPSIASAMRAPMEQLAKVAPTDASVLLTGETGTGKELFARAVHLQSRRATKPFVALNCAAIPAALFESELFGHEKGAFTGADVRRIGDLELADGGTLFLDEIGSMPREMQPKLLRVLEERRFRMVGASSEHTTDFRLICATNKDLRAVTSAGDFREDLYHRINVLPIHLPPLRDRSEDIPLLAAEFLKEFSGGKQRFAPDAICTLTELTWSGNVRELRNYVERLSILCESAELTVRDLETAPPSTSDRISVGLDAVFRTLVRDGTQSGHLLEQSERQLILSTLEVTGGNISRASRLLGITRSSLQRKIKEHQIRSS